MKQLGKPLPNRKNVVITRHMDYQVPEGVMVYHDLETALKELEPTTDELMIAGGGQIYQQLWDMGKVDKLYITHVHKEVDGDVMFPNLDLSKWKKVSEDKHEEFTWAVYER